MLKKMLGVAVLAMALAVEASAQMRTQSDYAWTPIVEQDGLDIAYIYYGAGEYRGGVVLRLRNRNAVPVDYRFVILIRSGSQEFAEEVQGRVGAATDKTGDIDGLFWTPFGTDRHIGEIGLRGLRVTLIK